MLQRPNGLHHIILDVLVAPWRENNIFWFFEVWHANRRRTKYSINSCPFFIWHLECNERSDKERDFEFRCPPNCVRRLFTDRDRTLSDWIALLLLLLKYFLDMSLNSRRGKAPPPFFWRFDLVNWSTLTGSPLRCAGHSGLRRCARQLGYPKAYKNLKMECEPKARLLVYPL